MADKSPSLPHDRQSLTGDEPILKGVNSRVLVERRGVYVAAMESGRYWRGIDQLVDMMTEIQVRRFKARCVRTALRKANSILHLFERKRPEDDRPRAALELVEQWLNDPDSVSKSQLRAA